MNNDVTRRDFVKTATAATAMVATLPAWATPEDRSPVKVGLIGCGGRGTGAAGQALTASPSVTMWSMGDAFSDRLKSSAKNLEDHAGDRAVVPEERRFVGFDAFQQVIDSGVDMVILTTPPHFRPQHLRAAVDAGKHVFCEKPMAVDGTGVRSVIASAEIAKAAGTNLVAGFCWRYNTPERATYQRIHDGAIGDVRSVYTTYLASPLNPQPRKEGWSDMEAQMRNWQHLAWLSGDHIVEQACHSIDKINWAMNGQTPLRATAVGGRGLREGEERGDIFDHFGVVFEYADGIRCHHLCRQVANCDFENNDYVVGSTGTCTINGWAPTHRIDGQNAWEYDGPKSNMYQVEHDELQEAIRGDRATINDGEWMARSTMMAILARESAYAGRTLAWDDVLNSDMRLGPREYVFGDLAMPEPAVPGITTLERSWPEPAALGITTLEQS